MMFNCDPSDRFVYQYLTLMLDSFSFTLVCQRLDLIRFTLKILCKQVTCAPFWKEPCCEKTSLRGFRPGPTQTGLYSHRRWLEA